MLDEFFEETQKYYYFFDALFKRKGGNKANALHAVGISDSSYRTERLKKNVNNENIPILLKYFDYQNISIDKKNSYEICLSKIYHSGFYRQTEELKILLTELEEYILDNNYLKPLFLLFKAYAYMHFDTRFSERKQLLIEDLEYIEYFTNDYFTKELRVIHQCVLLYYNMNYNLNKLESDILKYPNIRWLYYNTRGNRAYFEKNDLEAILYYQEALKEFQRAYNIERSLLTIANISLIYNTLGKYLFSLERLEDAVTYVHSSKNELWIKGITQHYLFSNYMLKRYKEILRFYEIIIFKPESLISVSAVICILAAYKLNCLDKAEEIIICHKDDYNVKIVLNYINKNERNILSNLEKNPYISEIVKTLR